MQQIKKWKTEINNKSSALNCVRDLAKFIKTRDLKKDIISINPKTLVAIQFVPYSEPLIIHVFTSEDDLHLILELTYEQNVEMIIDKINSCVFWKEIE